MSKKSAKKQELVAFISSFGTLRFPKLTTPDTDGKYADGKFKTDIILDDEDVDAAREQMEAAAKKFHPDIPFDEVNIPLKEFFNKDKESGEKTSVGWGIKSKSQRRPFICDARKKRLPDSTNIGGGTVARIGGMLAAYEREIDEVETDPKTKKKTKRKATEYGLTFYLNSVQIKELSAGGGFSDGSEFDEVEGYEYDESDDDSAVSDDATDL